MFNFTSSGRSIFFLFTNFNKKKNLSFFFFVINFGKKKISFQVKKNMKILQRNVVIVTHKLPEQISPWESFCETNDCFFLCITPEILMGTKDVFQDSFRNRSLYSPLPNSLVSTYRKRAQFIHKNFPFNEICNIQ